MISRGIDHGGRSILPSQLTAVGARGWGEDAYSLSLSFIAFKTGGILEYALLRLLAEVVGHDGLLPLVAAVPLLLAAYPSGA